MILKANNNHIDQIWEIERDVFDKPWSKRQLEKEIIFTKNSENLVYLVSNKVRGYILGQIILDEYHLYNIAVQKKYQKKKIAKNLLNYLIYNLLDSDVKIIFLEVSESNFPALNLYKSLGFKKYSFRKNYYRKGDNALQYNMEININDRMV